MYSITSSPIYPKSPAVPIPADYMDKILDLLEDYSLNTYLLRCQNYQTIESMLKNNSKVDINLLRRLLAVCIHDLNEGTKYTVVILNITSLVLKQNVFEDWTSLPELVSLGRSIINVLKKSTLTTSNMKNFQVLCFEKLELYPDEVLQNIPTADMIELLNVTLQNDIANKSLGYDLVCKYIRVLPPDNRKIFIEENLTLWFAKLLPHTMTNVVSKKSSANSVLNLLETITDILLEINYSENESWLKVFQFICTPSKYPSVLKHLLELDDNSWCRLWIILIKILKGEITSSKTKGVSPINAMLPVVEMAFKMGTAKRCQALRCWKVLIDSFSKEISEMHIIKGIKLFLIPLKSNNAKVTETALAKFDTWWYLIKKYRNKISVVPDILLSFLTFCFGYENRNSSILVPGLLSDDLKKLCVQAFVEITGHLDCKGCVPESFLRLEDKLLTVQFLHQHLQQWIYALKQVITITVSLGDNEVQRQMKCAWNSIISQIRLMKPDDGEKVNIIHCDILDMLIVIAKEHEQVAGLVYDFFLPSLVHDDSTKTLFVKTDNDMNFVKKLVKLVLLPNFNSYCQQCDAEKVVNNLMALTNVIVCVHYNSNKDTLPWLIGELSGDDCSLLMWTALMKSISNERIDIGLKTTRTLMLWPILHIESFKNYQYPASLWNSIYETSKSKLIKPAFQNIILKTLSATENQQNLFYLFAFMQILKQTLDNENGESYKIETLLLVRIFENIHGCDIVEAVFPLSIDVISAMIENNKLVNHTEFIFKFMDSVIKLLCKSFISKAVNNDQFSQHFLKLLDSLIRLLNTSNIAVPHFITHSVIECTKLLNSKSCGNDELYQFLTKLDTTETNYGKLKEIIESRNGKSNPDKSSFRSPKKKEASIVNTVVENGEEFVVVKSNWKFNPRKLTENQKEKFQRKKDIPALYQDLSQSQEGFKMSTWKTDSQDTTTGSKSTSKEGSVDFTNIFKKMPSTDVVPQIMENIMSDSPKSNKNENINSPSNKKSPMPIKHKKDATTPKEPKSPRVALKDRISQNVKSLVEKCSVYNIHDKQKTETSNTPKVIKPAENKDKLSLDQDTSVLPDARNETLKTVKNVDKIVELDTIDKIFTDQSLRLMNDLIDIKEKKQTSDTKPKKKRGRKAKIAVSTPPTPIAYISSTEIVDSSPKAASERPPRTRRKPKKFDADFEDFVKKRRRSLNTRDNDTDNQKDDTQIIACENETLDQTSLISSVKDNIAELNVVHKTTSNENSQEITNDTQIQPSSNDNQIKDKSEPEILPPKEPVNMIDTNTSHGSKSENNNELKTKTKRKPYKSRLEKNLAIDMVEGNPFLNSCDGKRKSNKSDDDTIVTRKKVAVDQNNDDINKCSQNDEKNFTKTKRLRSTEANVSTLTHKSTSSSNFSSDDLQMSEDFIESSQDSSVTSISLSSKTSVKKSPKVAIQIFPLSELMKSKSDENISSSLNEKSLNVLPLNQSKDDIELPANKSVHIDTLDLTAEMDTEPLTEQKPSNYVIVIEDDGRPEIEISSGNITNDISQNTANADTEPVDSQHFNSEIANSHPFTNDESVVRLEPQNTANADTEPIETTQGIISPSKQNETQGESNDITSKDNDGNGLSSPFKDGEQRNVDFLNNTLELSPIKIMSPLENERSPPRMKECYVVVKLTSPVQCNGEPFEKSSSIENSPEVFTDDRPSLDKRDQSPQRASTTNTNSSPSTSLSLKKNRPQVRAGGRAAHMLGLCVPDQIVLQKSNDQNEARTKTVTNAMSAKRNLRTMYNADVGDKNCSSDEDQDFLMLKRSVPSADSSPSGPILKRKLVEIADETTVSPASKRKRVSFHDPPVSTTVAIQKYLEPFGVRSPSSANINRMMPNRSQMKSPKKLENMFKLDTALSKTVECFNSPEDVYDLTDDIESSSLETQSIEVVKTTDLNDIDPICKELIHCTDPISEIATELSSEAMKDLLVQELEGKVETVGDLAKMTELEINRLRIKAPKIKVAKKVLTDYLIKKKDVGDISDATTLKNINLTSIVEKASEDMQVQITQDIEIQTNEIQHNDNSVQTEIVIVNSVGVEVKPSVKSISVEARPNVKSVGAQAKQSVRNFMAQTVESGNKTTQDIVNNLTQKPDYMDVLTKHLSDSAKMELMDRQPMHLVTEALSKKIGNTKNLNNALETLISVQKAVMATQVKTNPCNSSLVHQYMKEHILLCSELLKKIDKSTT